MGASANFDPRRREVSLANLSSPLTVDAEIIFSRRSSQYPTLRTKCRINAVMVACAKGSAIQDKKVTVIIGFAAVGLRPNDNDGAQDY